MDSPGSQGHSRGPAGAVFVRRPEEQREDSVSPADTEGPAGNGQAQDMSRRLASCTGQSTSRRPVLMPPPTQAGTPARGHDPTLQVYTGHREWLREARPFLCVPGGDPGSCPEHCWIRAPVMCPLPCAGQRFGSESHPPVSLTPSRAVPCTQQVLHNCTVISDGNVCVTSLWSPQEATEVGWHAHP